MINNYTAKIRSNGVKINLTIFEIDKSYPVIVFIPGMGCYANLYSDFLFQLSENGFNVIGVDLKGHGFSEGARGKFEFEDIIKNISDTVGYAIKNFNGNVGLLGSSFGGICALYAGIYEKRVKVILCHGIMDAQNDFYKYSRFPKLFYLWTRYFLFTAKLFPNISIPLTFVLDWNKVFDDKQALKKLKKDKNMVWNYKLGSLLSIIEFQPKEKFNNIKIPLNIVVGENDEIFFPSYCESIYKSLNSSSKNFEVIPNAGHMLPLEYSYKFIPIVVSWFKNYLV